MFFSHVEWFGRSVDLWSVALGDMPCSPKSSGCSLFRQCLECNENALEAYFRSPCICLCFDGGGWRPPCHAHSASLRCKKSVSCSSPFTAHTLVFCKLSLLCFDVVAVFQKMSWIFEAACKKLSWPLEFILSYFLSSSWNACVTLFLEYLNSVSMLGFHMY
jgi:hypothetical protein